MGAAFAMGAIGGSIWHGFKGYRNSPRGDRFAGTIASVKSRAPVVGGGFAVWSGLFNAGDCTLVAVRGKEDSWNAIMAGAATGGILAARSGPQAIAVSAAFGGIILGIMEGVGAMLGKLSSDSYKPVAPQIDLPPAPTSSTPAAADPVPASGVGLHKRSTYRNDGNSASADGGSSSTVFAALKEFDSYAKPLDDFTLKTSTGALVSLVSYIVIFILLLSEFTDWTKLQVNPSLDVDIARKEKMEITMNITFPKIPCFLLSIDVMDVSGDHQNEVDHSMMKARLSPDGRHIEATKGVIGEKHENTTITDPNYCGNCYGGSPPPSGCCNTPESIEQCVREGWSNQIKEQEGEGCNLSGHIEVNKVAGNFHFAPGRSFQQGGMHVHDLSAFGRDGANYDFTHTIHQLAFGPSGGFANPLDNHSKKASKGQYMYQYFVKVVSTKYVYLNSTVLNTNQIAVTEHERDLGVLGSGLPGVFFNFDISPMLVTYTEYKKPFSHFLTDVCAVVGGVFTVGGIIDGLIYTAEKRLKMKVDLGKAS
ncbi:Endoplasmic reticulum-Golgi intermediate compartment protein 3 [Entophlyctis luteolus]|nr:Endoplasmic reticulum-Golgi intermediate compartment protein 3 [Entophlyctis luteolus]